MDGMAVEGKGEEGEGTGRDRATTFHDGLEPYVKVGRLAVVKEMRRAKVGGWLVKTALEWLRTHPEVFDREGMRWNGLVCAHGQVQAVPAWERMGFKVDEGMGRWMEEGIEHVGMWIRLDLVRE
jgi:predicted GNAT family N-acyltransferase